MTNSRWKGVERAAAIELNKQLSGIGNHFTPVWRIPVNGREGPDLTINETGLVINVKSRERIPDRLFPEEFQMFFMDNLAIFPLKDLSCFNTFLMEFPQGIEPWKMLQDWYDRMESWTKQYKPDGISAILLHKPRMPYGNMAVVVHYENLRRLQCNLNKTKS
jgi:hypothetical protein